MSRKGGEGSPGIEENKLLFGASDSKNIVAVEFSGDAEVFIFERAAGGETSKRKVPFEPFLLISDENLIYGTKHKPVEIKELAGSGFFRFMAGFASWKYLDDAIKHLAIMGYRASDANPLFMHISDPVHQYLIKSGDTCFKGMRFSDLRRMTIDIETDCADEFDFSNAKRESDRILLIGLNCSDRSGDVEQASARDMGEKEMLEWLSGKIAEYDPDTIEGHNIFKFDLPYIAERARLHGVKLRWGRDGSEIKFRKSRLQVAERTVDYTRCDVFGRNVIDTWILAQYYDVQTRSLESTNLKHLAAHFGVAPEGRVFIEPGKIRKVFSDDHGRFLEYNRHDVLETVAISEILSYSHFIQARIFPYSYQNTVVRGNATKINALFIREYVREGWSLPRNGNRGAETQFEGGYADIFETGIIKNVGHCDVRSLYPSIMLTYGIEPANDIKKIFLPMLSTLRDFRVKTKVLAKKSSDDRDRQYYEALQGTFKTLINSFYGYLGSSLHNFSDVEAAAKVTEIGRETISRMVELLKKQKCRPVEIDTDGVYFVPPPTVVDDAGFEKIVGAINVSLPEGIEVEYDGRFVSMLSFKMKNYALLDRDGKLTIKGSALKSRGLEKYLRNFMGEMILLLLSEKSSQIGSVFADYHSRVERREMPIEEICKTETLTESPNAYKTKVESSKRNRAAQYELALKSGKDYQAGDSVSYYVTGDRKNVQAYVNCKLREQFDRSAPDYNVAYYLEKLKKQYNTFLEIANLEPSSGPALSGQGELF